LNNRQSPPPLLREGVVVHLLSSQGVLPDLLRCTRCRSSLRARAFGFPGGQRGFICVSCGAEPEPALTDVVKLFRLLLRNPVLSRGLTIPETLEQRTQSLTQSLLRSHARSVGVHSSA
jgi:recombinational DNA repair protein (RecF pathway)